MTEEESFRIKIEGPSFNENGTSLNELLKVYSAIDGLFESTHSNIAGYEKYTKINRNPYQIIINEAKIGSWDSYLKILIAVSPALFNQGLTPKDYLETIFVTYEFLNSIFTLRKKGEKYRLNVNGSGNRIEIIKENNVTNIYNAPVTINLVANAQKSLPDYREIADILKSGNMTSLKINSSNSSKSIKLTSEDANLFDLVESRSSEIKIVYGEIYRFNKRTRTGKIHISEADGIVPGKYTFSVKKDNQIDIILSMQKNEGTFSVLEIFIEDPITGKQILDSLEIVDL
ncbi:hypothetical protein [Leptospira levettii]|uniref:DUF4469 domain-containing protein n=1 Tax=Leptospira levettii TaxID=2023178 RepID=A0ABY2MIV1_9LEPT|nr:hypothetical protein [Leptospira levettii]PKA22574.1 hypothetical protein CH381_30200 [Leptospira sp. mixed culture ATI2-C-A1]TGL66514.1 hypothetical protein EHQ60_18695 [Leptospira levettii]